MVCHSWHIFWHTVSVVLKNDYDPPRMKKNKTLVTILAFAFHLVLLFWAFQQVS